MAIEEFRLYFSQQEFKENIKTLNSKDHKTHLPILVHSESEVYVPELSIETRFFE